MSPHALLETGQMALSLKQLCTPRPSVFDRSSRDVVLDITDLLQDRINPREFFAENYPTLGMQQLLRQAFARFHRQSDAPGVFVLTQAMGGGKTHSMIALGLLAKHPELRERLLDTEHRGSGLGRIRVVGFTGRESDAPLGIWGSIAEQLGKKDAFSSYYSPLQAPGQTAWIDLLKGEPLLILLDELPPYFENARSRQIGNSDLATVTTTALSNLLVAVGKAELENVCVVISDLKATYEGGSQQISQALHNFQNEVARGAVTLEPVGVNTDEVYHILRKRIFESLPDEDQVVAVAQGYAKAVRDAKQMDITNASPEQFAAHLRESYPFHFSIRDLYARFRHNPGFQQTRGLIRLMRTLVGRLYESGRADEIQLIHPYDLDLNHRQTLAEITQINPTLENAIAHDIASEGAAVAEILDRNRGEDTDAQGAAKLILVSSLANVPNPVRGLSLPEIVSYLCAPDRDVSGLTEDVLKPYTTKAWYLHTSREGKLYFRDTQNLVAKLKTTAESYSRESSLRELREFLKRTFTPSLKDCYQDVQALPAIDQIDIRSDRVTMVIQEPHPTGNLHPALRSFYDDLVYKNRILFLTGERGSLERLLEIAAELKAIRAILEEMDAEKVPENDVQRISAIDIRDKLLLGMLSAARETFTTLYYPHGDGIVRADFLMNFKDNQYNGEAQIREALRSGQKFTEEVTGDTFRRKCEQRLFTQQQMPWSEVKNRAARNAKWQWHHPAALDALKDDLVARDQWREAGGYVDKGPFPAPATTVNIQQLGRNDDTGEASLRLRPVHGDVIHYEVGGPATPSSARVEDPHDFRTAELEVSFLCVDSSGAHDTGEAVTWRNRITLKSGVFQAQGDKMVELQAAPPAPIRYTTDGSSPKSGGGLYEGPFAVPPGTRIVLAVAEKHGIVSDEHRRDIYWDESTTVEVDPAAPAVWRRPHRLATTREAYAFLEQAKRFEAELLAPRVIVSSEDGGSDWVELVFGERLRVGAAVLDDRIRDLRAFLSESAVQLDTDGLAFPTGQHLLDWVEEVRTELVADEVEQ